MIRDHNQLDVDLYEFSKGLFEESLQKKQAAIQEGLAALRTLSTPGAVEGFCNSTLGAGRFLVNKIASAV